MLKWALASILGWTCATLLFLFLSLNYLITYKSDSTKPKLEPNVLAALIEKEDSITPWPTLSPPPLNHEDIRIVALRKFLQKYQSPLLTHVSELVQVADEYGIDYTILPSIAMQESGGCKRIPVDSYNCWGFGIYGDKITHFASYLDGFRRVAKVIKETYIKKGVTNITLLEDYWTPSSEGNWSYAVTHFMSQIKQNE